MTNIVDAKSLIQVEEVDVDSIVAERTMQKIGASINWLVNNAGDTIGTVITALLTEAQFAVLKGYDHTEGDLTEKKWIIMSGQNITGSDFSVLTGINTAPNTTGNASFLGQKGSAHTLGQQQSAANLAHTHNMIEWQNEDVIEGWDFLQRSPRFYEINRTRHPFGTTYYQNTSSNGEAEMRPNTLRVNYFLKINN